jgi:NADPH:quinone reductase-like Zn-dependent oxidoreductase
MFSPLRDYLTIKADKDDKKSGDFHLVREWDKLPHTGTVESVGPKVTQIEPGDYVRFNRYAFEKIGEDLFIGIEQNVVAKINEE